jgi:hypothetical protein
MTDIRKLLNLVEEFSEEITEQMGIGDSFSLEITEDTVIETGVIGFMSDGVVIYGDNTVMELLKHHGVMLESVNEKMIMGVSTDAAGSGTVGEADVEEAKYQGRTVQLNKPMAGDVAKSKVYVKGPKGNVVKVNFGDKTMRIKKSIPGRRKSFRARHRCENPGPKWKARYWSCKAW